MLLNRYTLLFRRARCVYVCFAFDHTLFVALAIALAPPPDESVEPSFPSDPLLVSYHQPRLLVSLAGPGVDNFFEPATPDHPFFPLDESNRLEFSVASTSCDTASFNVSLRL